MIVRESMYQSVEISPKKPISREEILKLMNIARRTRTYVKFTVNNGKYYIMVTYHRNGLITLSSNIKQDRVFLTQLFWTENRGYSEIAWAEFIRIWINKFSRKYTLG